MLYSFLINSISNNSIYITSYSLSPLTLSSPSTFLSKFFFTSFYFLRMNSSFFNFANFCYSCTICFLIKFSYYILLNNSYFFISFARLIIFAWRASSFFAKNIASWIFFRSPCRYLFIVKLFAWQCFTTSCLNFISWICWMLDEITLTLVSLDSLLTFKVLTSFARFFVSSIFFQVLISSYFNKAILLASI